MEVLIAVAIVAGIGLLLGLGLAIASIVLAVPKDEKAEAIEEILPGANCGACGYSGCPGYAAALSKGEAAPNLCSPGGAEVMQAIAELTGGGAMEMERKTAMVMCNGTCDNTSQKMEYDGIETCAAAALTGGGTMKCSYGCMGFGDCVNSCEYNALSICNGVAVVKPALCVACTMCVKACPKNLIRMVPARDQAVVVCNNQDKGAVANKVCSVSCIGCMKCVKACEDGAVKVENFRAIIDPDKCTNCGKCAEVCPKNCILLCKF